MGSEDLAFYLFGAVAIAASLLVIAQRNPIYSVLLLIASFGALSGLYILLDAPFVAVIQIIVYAGAIMVLFLFVIMLLGAEMLRHRSQVLPWQPFLAFGLGVLFVAVLAYVTSPEERTEFARSAASLCDVWISNEAPRVFPEIAARTATPGPPGHFLLAVNGAPVAWTDPHGASIEWIA